MKKTSKILLTSLATIAMSASLVVGGTYALFTSEDSVNIAVTAGTVGVSASIGETVKTGCTLPNVNESFKATVNEAKDGVNLENMLPGDYAEVEINIENTSSVAIQYRVIATVEDNGLADVLEITYSAASKWTPVAAGKEIDSVTVKVALPENVTGEYSGKGANISFTVEAVQSNGVVEATKEQDVVDALAAGRPVVLAEDISINTVTELSGDSYIDLNGHTLTGAISGDRPFKLTDSASLTIMDGEIALAETGYGLIEIPQGVEDTSIVMENVNVSGKTANGALIRLREGNGNVDVTLNNVNFNVEGGWIISTNDASGTFDLTINGGNYTSENGIQTLYGTALIKDASFTIDRIGFEVAGSKAVFENCYVNIVESHDIYNAGIAASYGAEVAVNNSYVNATEGAYAYAVYSTLGTITVNGGAYNGALYVYNEECIINLDNSKTMTVVSNVENIAEVEAGAVVTLAEDLTLNQAIEAKGDLTIIGNGKELTTSSGRFVNVKGTNDATVKLQGVVLNSEVERGVSFYGNTGNLDVVIEDCDINVSHYGVNVASENENATLVIKDSTIEGFCAFQTWSANTNVTFENCTLIGTNQWKVESGCFATIVVNSGANNCVLTFNNCTIIANKNSELGDAAAEEYHVIDNAEGTVISFNNCTFFKDGAEVEGAVTPNDDNE